MVQSPVPAEPRRHVADDDVRLSDGFCERLHRRGILKVCPPHLDPGNGEHSHAVDGHDPALLSDEKVRDLRPAAGSGAEVDDSVSLKDEVESSVDLNELKCRA